MLQICVFNMKEA